MVQTSSVESATIGSGTQAHLIRSSSGKVSEDDTFNFIDLDSFSPNKQLTIEVVHSDGSIDIIKTNHTYNAPQIEWYKEGSALNLIKKGA